ncbi:MAG: calcium/sodium antiporter [Cyanobacteriota bacterium]
MIELFGWIILFIVSLAILIKASDLFVDSAELIGKKFNIPKFVIGATVIALGTSLPELVSSIIAVLKDSSEIVAGNVIGSNITNILMIFGVTGLLYKEMIIPRKVVVIDSPILIISSLLLLVTIYDGSFTLKEAFIFLLFFIFYNIYLVKVKDKRGDDNLYEEKDEKQFTWKSPVLLILSSFLIFLGAKYTIDSVIEIANIMNVGKEVIAITAIALGTSLPELIVCLSAAKKNRPEIILGNILGSNIFNTLGVMSIPALFGNLVIPHDIIMYGLPVMCFVSLLFLFVVSDKKFTRNEGITLLVLYILFIAGLFITPGQNSISP